MAVTPTINNDGSVTLTLLSGANKRAETLNPQEPLPPVFTKVTKALVHVSDGDIIAVGGFSKPQSPGTAVDNADSNYILFVTARIVR
jgi:type II secretory pathway component GspD/PulD (secretin)